MNYTIVGTATHGGGSCQISMSYDQGATWSVIFSQIGGCPVDDMTTSITIPSAASSGEALFAWSWFNLQGNREMYQNCAVVTITNGGAGLDSSTYPTPFVANAGVNDCKTIENTAVVFPNPGPNVRYGGAYKDTKPTTPAGFTGSNCVGPGAGSSNSSASGSSSSDVQPVAASAKSSPATAATSTGAADARTTLWQGSPSNPSSAVTAQDVSPSDSSPSPVTTGQAKTCNRKRKRSSSFAGSEKRHERLARRSDEEARDDVDRVAAGKAEHVARA